MCSIEFYVTSGRTAEINSKKSAEIYRGRDHSLKQSDVLLCRSNTTVTKDDMDIRKNAFKNKTFTIRSRQSIKNTLQQLNIYKT